MVKGHALLMPPIFAYLPIGQKNNVLWPKTKKSQKYRAFGYKALYYLVILEC